MAHVKKGIYHFSGFVMLEVKKHAVVGRPTPSTWAMSFLKKLDGTSEGMAETSSDISGKGRSGLSCLIDAMRLFGEQKEKGERNCKVSQRCQEFAARTFLLCHPTNMVLQPEWDHWLLQYPALYHLLLSTFLRAGMHILLQYSDAVPIKVTVVSKRTFFVAAECHLPDIRTPI